MMEEEPTLRCVPCDLQSTFECITCDFLASTGQELRVHYKNDHHRYNCRRCVRTTVIHTHTQTVQHERECCVDHLLQPSQRACATEFWAISNQEKKRSAGVSCVTLTSSYAIVATCLLYDFFFDRTTHTNPHERAILNALQPKASWERSSTFQKQIRA